MYIYDNISLNTSRSDKRSRSRGENQNTYYIFSTFFPENCAFYEITWKNTVEPDGPLMTIPDVVEKIKTRIICSVPFFRKIVPFMR
jgi:hypothetical protein